MNETEIMELCVKQLNLELLCTRVVMVIAAIATVVSGFGLSQNRVEGWLIALVFSGGAFLILLIVHSILVVWYDLNLTSNFLEKMQHIKILEVVQ